MFRVAIDGPAGAGKSTISKRVASELSFVYVDTGAMYRSVALYMLRKNIDLLKDTEKIIGELDNITIKIKYSPNGQIIILNGEDVTGLIRTENVSKGASAVAVIPQVRMKLVELQREIAKNSDVIMDGRDIGTYVLPDAELKIYLTASVEARARRRYDELAAKNIRCIFTEVCNDIKNRDKNDMNRKFAPLKQADDAVLVDTTDDTLEEAVDRIRKLILDKLSEVQGCSIM